MLLQKIDTATGKQYLGKGLPSELDDTAKSQVVTSIDLASGSWALNDGLYEYEYSNALILSTSIVTVVPDNVDIDIVIDAEILPYVLVEAGSITLYAKNAPSGNIQVNLIIQI
jgi:hypothetical protein